MTRKILWCLAIAGMTLAVLPVVRPLQAAVIVGETFDGADGTSVVGLAPNVASLPGGVFTAQTNRGSYLIANNTLKFGPDHSLNVPLGAFYLGDLTVSAELSYGSLITNTANNRGIALGFNASPTGSWNVTFTGLRLTPDSKLTFQSGNSVKATVAVSTIGSTFYSLSYDVNVDTGVISNISLGGNAAADFSSIYTASQTTNYFSGSPNLSVFAGGSAAGQYGYVDNLSLSNVSAVPEPGSFGIMGSAGLTALTGLAYRRRRRHRVR